MQRKVVRGEHKRQARLKDMHACGSNATYISCSNYSPFGIKQAGAPDTQLMSDGEGKVQEHEGRCWGRGGLMEMPLSVQSES